MATPKSNTQCAENPLGIGITHGIFLVVASMLGTGIMTTTGLIATVLPSPLNNLLIWIAGGGFALLGAYCYGILIAHNPRSGGEVGIFRRFYSHQLGDITGWLSFFVGFGAANAATALAMAAYLKTGLSWAGISGSGLTPNSLAVGAIVLMTGVHSIDGHRGLRIQTGVAILKLSMLAGVACYGLANAEVLHFLNWKLETALPMVNEGVGSPPLSAVFLWVIFAYSGWNAAVYSAGEFSDPARTVPRAMLVGTALVTVLYITLNVTLLNVFSTEEIAGVIPVLAMLAERLFSSNVAGIFSLLVGIALLSSIGASCFAGPRVLQAVLSKHKADQRDNRPPSRWIIWAQAAISSFLILTGTFEQILSIMGLFLGIFPILAVFSLYRTSHWGQSQPPRFARYIAAPIFLIASVFIVVISTWQQPTTSVFVWGLIAVFIFWNIFHERLWSPACPPLDKK